MRVELDTPGGPGVAEIDRPTGAAHALLVLTHGAGGGVDAADLKAVRLAAVAAGIAAVGLTQPYRVAGRRTPPVPGRQDEAWLAALAALRKRPPLSGLPLVVGGRSNGARVAARTAPVAGAVGVVALAYPLHPPGRPDNTRLPELDAAGVPVLVVQGERDPFGMPPAGPDRDVLVIPGADHSLKRELPKIAEAVTAFVTSLGERAKVQR
jgi:predicted alpha/beta-hydrolase family hydrolase